MSRKIFLFAMMIAMMLIGLAQTAPLKGHIIFAKFEEVENDSSKSVIGRITFTELSNGKITRVVAQFNGGFTSVNVDDYEFLLGDKDLSEDFREQIIIDPPGTTPFSKDFNDWPINEIVGKSFEIKLDGKTIGKSKTQFI